jgi:tetratricopeptide (TPR) repeat protein
MGACLSKGEALKIKYIPGYEHKLYGESVEKKTHVKKFHELGITMAVIDQFIEDCGGEEGLRGLTTREVCDVFLKPMMFSRIPGNGGSYALYTYQRQKQKRVSTVRDAEVYVVHAWDSIFLDVVDTMRNYIAPLPSRDIVTLWFDMLCINQCKKRQNSVAWFETSFVNGINNMNHVLVAMIPWQKPLVFERTWCLWELYTCANQQGTPQAPLMHYGLPAAQYLQFKESIVDPSPATIPYSYFRMVDQIDLNMSNSKSSKHRKNIIAACQHGHMQNGQRSEAGDPALVFEANNVVTESVKNWVISEAKSTLAKSMDGTSVQVEAQIALANIYRYLGMATKAIPLLTRALEHHKVNYGKEHIKTINVAYLLGNIYCYERKLDQALELYEYCLDMRRKLNGDAHPQTLHMVLCTALLYNNCNKVDEQFTLYETMLQAYRDDLGDESEYTVAMLCSLSNLQLVVGRSTKDTAIKHKLLVQAEKNMRTTLDHWTKNVGAENPDTLYMLAKLAEVNYTLGNHTKSNKLFGQHYELISAKFKKLGKEFDPEVLESWHEWSVSLLHEPTMLDRAEKELLLLLGHRKRVLGYQQPDTLKTRDSLWNLWRKQGKHDMINQQIYDSREDRQNFAANTNLFSKAKSIKKFSKKSAKK